MSAKSPISTAQQKPGQVQQQQTSQRLIMSAHMQQAIHLLQLPLQELETFIEEQVVLNPILDITEQESDAGGEGNDETARSEGDEVELTISDQDLSILNRLEEDWREHFAQSDSVPVKRTSEEDKLKSYLEQSICADRTLNEQLHLQAHDTFDTPRGLEIAEVLIGYIDEFGFLKTPLAEICLLHHIQDEEIKEILQEIQTFEPFGVGASSIQESLLIQLRCQKKEQTLAYQIVRDHYDDLLHNHIPLIQKQLKCNSEDLQQAIEHDIAKLDLHPGRQFSSEATQAIVPDVTLRQENDKLLVEVERDRTPSLHLNLRYLNMLKEPSTSKETKHFIKHHLFSARWLMRNLQQRYSTLERIAQSLAVRQYDFFSKADGQLVPLTMKTLADELNVHESTVARTVANKYINSPRGIFPLRAFFTNKYVSEEGDDLSSSTVRETILALLAEEDKKHPLSDEKISHLLKEKGITCARRTVAKYRTALNIGNTQQRKKFH